MPVEIEYPPQSPPGRGTDGAAPDAAAGLRIALVNNMPDSALVDTEEQFRDLLDAAAGGQSVRLTRHALPGVRRGPEAAARLAREYFGMEELLARRYDGVIITGTEPCQADLRAEPYWPALTRVLAWAEQHTRSAVLSCMAAHAAVLEESGIARHRVPGKRLGIFREQLLRPHALTADGGATMAFPHSRWNDVRGADLARHGYELLTESPEAGVGLFTKQRGDSLFVHLQGHPEYRAATLLKEYRRDVRRFLLGQRPDYPGLPQHYFDQESARALAQFQHRAQDLLDPIGIEEFPDAAIALRLRHVWARDATRLYANWLGYLTARPAAAAMALEREASLP